MKIEALLGVRQDEGFPAFDYALVLELLDRKGLGDDFVFEAEVLAAEECAFEVGRLQQGR